MAVHLENVVQERLTTGSLNQSFYRMLSSRIAAKVLAAKKDSEMLPVVSGMWVERGLMDDRFLWSDSRLTFGEHWTGLYGSGGSIGSGGAACREAEHLENGVGHLHGGS